MQRKEKPPADPVLRRMTEELIRYKGGGHNPDLVIDIIENALKLLTDVKSRGDVRVIQTAVRELRYAFKLFEAHRDTHKVTMFGSARTMQTRAEYLQAIEFARKIAAAGWMVITGAGPGIMQAGHEGAGPEKSFGANIRLPWEQSANPVMAKDKKLITFKYFFTRKFTFVRQSDALVLFPGGFGTLDEGFEALTLMQTGKSQIMPLILLDAPGATYWKRWDANIRETLLANEFISPEDLYLYEVLDDADAAVRVVTRFYRNYHSMRFVKRLLVIRLKQQVSRATIRRLNREFKDIILEHPIKAIAATPEEREDNQCLDLPRLAFEFDRRQYGRLRQLIDELNEA